MSGQISKLAAIKGQKIQTGSLIKNICNLNSFFIKYQVYSQFGILRRKKLLKQTHFGIPQACKVLKFVGTNTVGRGRGMMSMTGK